MKELKITKGEAFVNYISGIPIGVNAKIFESNLQIYSKNICEIILPETDEDWLKEKEETTANLELIAETFNVANETGLTPRELLEQRNELLEALKELCFLNSCEEEGLQSGRPKPEDWLKAFRKAESAINKANGKGV